MPVGVALLTILILLSLVSLRPYTLDAGERALELSPQGLVTVEEASTSEIRLRDVHSGRILKRWSIPRGGSLFWGRQSGPVVVIRGSGATDENQIATLRHLEKSHSWIRVPARALRGSTLTTLDQNGRTLSAWMGVRMQRLPGLPVPVTLAPPNAIRASIVAIAVSPKTACVTLWLPDNAEAVPRFQTLVLVDGR